MTLAQRALVGGLIMAAALLVLQWPAVPNFGLLALLGVCIGSGSLFDAGQRGADTQSAATTLREVLLLQRGALIPLLFAYGVYVDPSVRAARFVPFATLAIVVSIVLLLMAHVKFRRAVQP